MKYNMVDSPSDIFTSRVVPIAPPGVSSLVRVKVSEPIDHFQFQQIPEHCSFGQSKTCSVCVSFWKRQIVLFRSDIKISNDNCGFGLVQQLYVLIEESVIIATERKSDQHISSIGFVHVDNEKLLVLKRNESSLLRMLLVLCSFHVAEIVIHIQRSQFRDDSHTRIAFLCLTLVKIVVSIRDDLLDFIALVCLIIDSCLIQAQNVWLTVFDVLLKFVFRNNRAQSIHVPARYLYLLCAFACKFEKQPVSRQHLFQLINSNH